MPDHAPPPDAPGGGVLAGRYVLVTPIASGGMARVWEATDSVLDRPVAVKILHPHMASDELFVARFRAEAVNAARLTHPGIVSIYDTFSDDGVEAIVMELVRGTTLRHLLNHRGPLQPSESVTITDHVAGALGAAHAAGIVHRDVKPGNVLLAADGRVLVADFGIAKAAEGNDLTADSTMLGTAKYLAPEQVEGGPVDGRSDLYGLGVVLYEMLCGEVPFHGENDAATALARLQRPPDPPHDLRPGLSPSLEAVVLALLERHPEDRPQDAAELRRQLATVDRRLAPPHSPAAAYATPPPHGVTATPEIEAPAATAGAAPPRPAQRRRLAILVAATLAVIVTVAVVVAIVVSRSQGPVGPLAIAEAVAFDPLGHPPGQENNAEAHFAVDGNPKTTWTTESYRNPDAMGKLGVGLIVRLGHPADVSAVEVSSPSAHWSASLYAVTGPAPSTLEGWGAPETKRAGVGPGVILFDLGGVRADAMLIWITRTGDDGRVAIAEVAASGR